MIHGDLAHYNLVARRDPETGRPWLSGVIDFGDVGEGWAVTELSTAIAALLAKEDMAVLEQVGTEGRGWWGRMCRQEVCDPLPLPSCWPPHITGLCCGSGFPLHPTNNRRSRGQGIVAFGGGTGVRPGGQVCG